MVIRKIGLFIDQKSQIPELPSITTPECYWSLGDANWDETVDKKDADYICKIILKKEPILSRLLTDVNGDGEIDMGDAMQVYDLFIK